MNLVIFGANGPVGKLLTQQALSGGHEVGAVTRHPETFPIKHDRLTVLSGDVFNADDVARAIDLHAQRGGEPAPPPQGGGRRDSIARTIDGKKEKEAARGPMDRKRRRPRQPDQRRVHA